MKKIILLSALIISTVFVFAGQNRIEENETNIKSVSGQVIDKTTNEVLAGVTVTANGNKVYTDFDGKFTISNLCGENCKITISQISYEPKELELNLKNSKKLNVSLSKR